MRRVLSLAAACAALGAVVVVTSASAAYDTPYRAEHVGAGMVTAYNQCTSPTLTHRPVLTLPACAPTPSSANNPTNVYSFGYDGSPVRKTGYLNVSLESGTSDIRIHVTGRHVWKSGSDYTGTDLRSAAVIRMTDNGCFPSPYDGDCTSVDFPFPAELDCRFGSCDSSESSLNAIVPSSIHSNDKLVFEIGQISIIDEDGDTFARAGSLVGRTGAATAFNTPKQSDMRLSSMVPAYNQCTAPSETHRPNLAFPACSPAPSTANNPANTYTFGPSGSAADGGWFNVEVGHRHMNRDNLRAKLRGKDIYKDGGRYSGDGLVMTSIIRSTDNGCGALYDVDCTMVDFPFPVALRCTRGSCRSLKGTWNAIVPGALSKEETSNLEMGQIAVVDEDGDAVAREGLYVK